jgi:glutathione S-transferase
MHIRCSAFPSGGEARWQALTLQSLGDGVLDSALIARYEDVARPEALRWPQWRSGQLDKAHTAFAALEADVQLLRDRVDIGSITVGCAIWYLDLRFADLAWRDACPQLAAWYAGFSQRPSMQRVWALPG